MPNDQDEDPTEEIHNLVIDWLKPAPLVVWGSGGTIPFGLPSMECLKRELGITEEGNLEEILSEIKDDKQIKKYQNKIFDAINKSDSKLRNHIATQNTLNQDMQNVLEMFKHFCDTVTGHLDIITTNYDCFLEYLFSHEGLPYTDGFSGQELSRFNFDRLKRTKNIINIIKPHGSIRWGENDRYSYYNESMKAIYPWRHKYEEIQDPPFRGLVLLSNEKIKQAKSFLIIGFGFNDKHLTPIIEEAAERKIVVVTRKATDSAHETIKRFDKFVLLEEESSENKTRVTYKNGDKDNPPAIIEGRFWNPSQFVTMLK